MNVEGRWYFFARVWHFFDSTFRVRLITYVSFMPVTCAAMCTAFRWLLIFAASITRKVWWQIPTWWRLWNWKSLSLFSLFRKHWQNIWLQKIVLDFGNKSLKVDITASTADDRCNLAPVIAVTSRTWCNQVCNTLSKPFHFYVHIHLHGISSLATRRSNVHRERRFASKYLMIWFV